MLTAISGGIGCGKTIVSRMVEAMGFPVYDCDSQAARIMDEDEEIKRAIAERIHPEALRPDGSIDRRRLSEIVFADYEALQRLNEIVHAAVRNDVRRWSAQQTSPVSFVETAILYQSGLDRMVDAVWEVDAPLDLRVERVMKRNGIGRSEVLARIASQDRFVAEERHACVAIIVNDGFEPLLPQIERLLGARKSG